jgi:hypothetical protein
MRLMIPAALFSTLLLATNAHAAAQPGAELILVNKVEGLATVTLARRRGVARVGILSLLVRNTSPKIGGRLRARFFTNDGTISELVGELPDPLPQDRPALTTPNRNLVISTGQTRLLRVTFTVGPQADASHLDGHLVVTLASQRRRSSIEPLIVATKGTFASTPASGKKRAQPAKPTLVVTSWWPIRHSRLQGESQRIFTLPRRAEQLARREVAILGSEDLGEQLRVVLTSAGAEGSHDGFTRAEVKVDQVGGPATYKATSSSAPMRPRLSRSQSTFATSFSGRWRFSPWVHCSAASERDGGKRNGDRRFS